MDRLTKCLPDGQAVMDCTHCEFAGDNCALYGCRNRLKDRLAYYEDLDERGKLITLHEHCIECPIKDRLAEFITYVIEPAPPVHAHWIWKGKDKGYWCSNCGGGCLLNMESDWHDSDYCPHCGAKMDKEN